VHKREGVVEGCVGEDRRTVVQRDALLYEPGTMQDEAVKEELILFK
jgi:hypothetical protein